MANEQNLIPQNRRTVSEQRDFSRKGGIASGAARRERRQLREALQVALDMPSTGGESNREAIAAALVKQALQGNVKAFEVIRDTIGEKPAETVAIAQPDYTALDEAFARLKPDKT